MHDPMTVAHEIRNPFTGRSLVTIWHVDPCKDGSDDSCGWFQRARHGDEAVLAKIASAFEFEWSHGVPFGWFDEKGDPNYSSQSIALSMFRIAANHVFGHWTKKADRFLRDNLHGILHFAENSCDSMHDFITRHYQKKHDEPERRKERIRSAASMVYGWIIRADRPWWKHPKWHVWHWKLQIHALQSLRRKLFTRCVHCGGRFKNGEGAVGNHWDEPPRRWFESFRSERGLSHMNCSGVCVSPAAANEV